MKRIRCCIVDPKKKYRGIDREVDMHLFNHMINDQSYQKALDQYIKYLDCEEEYTPDKLAFMTSFAELINCFYAKCEIVVYSTHRIEDVEKISFLGIDVIDQHMKSILKKAKRPALKQANQYGLFLSEEDANIFIEQAHMLGSAFSDLFYVYSYGTR